MRSLHRGIEDKYDGKWTDMSEMKDSLIERAYSQLNEKLGSKETFTSISLDSKDTFTIDNYPIKAILAPNKWSMQFRWEKSGLIISRHSDTSTYYRSDKCIIINLNKVQSVIIIGDTLYQK